MKELTDECLKASNDSILATVEKISASCFWKEVFDEIKKELGEKR